jgi:hypothetical protein
MKESIFLNVLVRKLSASIFAAPEYFTPLASKIFAAKRNLEKGRNEMGV